MANTTTTKTIAWKNGLTIIHAGTPLDTNGKPVMDNTAVGIVAEDVQMPDKTATVITAGEWDESVNVPYFHISDTVKAALSSITFTPPVKLPLETILADYVRKTGETLNDLEDDPTAGDINAMLEVLRGSGLIEEEEEEEPEETEET